MSSTTLTHHQVELKKSGVSLHYVEQGPASGPVVLLCHGWPEFWYCWHKQIPALAKAGYRVLAPDLRGYGQTRILSGKGGREQYTFKAVSGDLIELMDLLGIHKFVIIGHDWGGALVWNTARRYPTRVSAVASVCTPYMPRGDEFRPLKEVVDKIPQFAYQIYFSEQREEAARTIEKDIPHFFRLLFSKVDRSEKKRVGGLIEVLLLKSKDPPGSFILSPEEHKMYVETFKKTGFGECLHWYGTGELNYKDEVADKLAREIDQPALVVTCGQDRVLTPALSAGMEKWIRRLSRGHVEDAGHWVQSEYPAELNEILVNWLKSLPALSSKL